MTFFGVIFFASFITRTHTWNFVRLIFISCYIITGWLFFLRRRLLLLLSCQHRSDHSVFGLPSLRWAIFWII